MDMYVRIQQQGSGQCPMLPAPYSGLDATRLAGSLTGSQSSILRLASSCNDVQGYLIHHNHQPSQPSPPPQRRPTIFRLFCSFALVENARTSRRQEPPTKSQIRAWGLILLTTLVPGCLSVRQHFSPSDRHNILQEFRATPLHGISQLALRVTPCLASPCLSIPNLTCFHTYQLLACLPSYFTLPTTLPKGSY